LNPFIASNTEFQHKVHHWGTLFHRADRTSRSWICRMDHRM